MATATLWTGLSALFRYLLAPALVGLVAAYTASRQFRHQIASEKHHAAEVLIDELLKLASKVEERGEFCLRAGRSGNISDLPILGDLQIPDVLDQASKLGPRVIGARQALYGKWRSTTEAISTLHRQINERAVSGSVFDVKATSADMKTHIDSILAVLYSTCKLSAQAARIPLGKNATYNRDARRLPQK